MLAEKPQTAPATDVLAEWLRLGREVLERYYPTAAHAALVIELGDDLPAVQLVVTPTAAFVAGRRPPE